MRYLITAAILYEYKKDFDGCIFWRVAEGLGIIVKQAQPNDKVTKILQAYGTKI